MPKDNAEKLVYELRVVETEGGFRVELNGDKERLRPIVEKLMRGERHKHKHHHPRHHHDHDHDHEHHHPHHHPHHHDAPPPPPHHPEDDDE